MTSFQMMRSVRKGQFPRYLIIFFSRKLDSCVTIMLICYDSEKALLRFVVFAISVVYGYRGTGP